MCAVYARCVARFEFVFYGERPSLDFANTLRRRKDPNTPTLDLLLEQGIGTWFEKALAKASWAAELPALAPDAENSDSFIERGISLRDAILSLAEMNFDAASGTIQGAPELSVLNTCASGAPLAYRFSEDGLLVPSAIPEMILSFVASDAIRLFSSAASRRVKMCAHERCGILFEDRSNGMRRQWCSMKECGNRAKAARYASTATDA